MGTVGKGRLESLLQFLHSLRAGKAKATGTFCMYRQISRLTEVSKLEKALIKVRKDEDTYFKSRDVSLEE